MSMRRLYNNTTYYIYNLQQLYTFEYNTIENKNLLCNKGDMLHV